jgi:XTP/dITP diphosphohydrolase
MMTPCTLILGTHNAKKGRELAGLLAPHGLTLKTLADCEDPVTVVEDGDTFAANATKKATEQAVHLGQWVLGEDSGLRVDALGGAPGVYSARYSGENASDESNNQHLLAELGDLPLAKRTAGYTCCMALSDSEGNVRAKSRGTCRGRIRTKPAGDTGFGYDPLFEVVEYHRTFAELGDMVKAMLSHRGRAMRQMVAAIKHLVHTNQW